MRAVDLIPADERRGASAGGRSSGAVYALIGALACLVLMATAYTVADRSVSERRAELARVTAEADRAEAAARALDRYTRFSAVRQERTQTVTSLAKARFDWAHVLHELARTIPAGARISSLTGAAAGAAAGGAPAAGATPAGAGGRTLSLEGCTPTQDDVADLMTALRRIDGVERVSLTSSSKGGAKTAAAPAGTSAGACGDDAPTFDITVSFRAAATTPAAGATPTPTTSKETP